MEIICLEIYVYRNIFACIMLINCSFEYFQNNVNFTWWWNYSVSSGFWMHFYKESFPYFGKNISIPTLYNFQILIFPRKFFISIQCFPSLYNIDNFPHNPFLCIYNNFSYYIALDFCYFYYSFALSQNISCFVPINIKKQS